MKKRDYKAEYKARQERRDGRESRRGANLRHSESDDPSSSTSPGDAGAGAKVREEAAPAGLPPAQVVRPTVQEDRSRPIVAAPVHPSASDVPPAGDEGGDDEVTGEKQTDPNAPPGSATGEPAPGGEALVLDPKTVTQILKGAFDLVSIVTHEDHWKVEDDEVDNVAEPLCRQLQRIPIIRAIGQDAADLIIIGSTLGALLYFRIRESAELRRAKQEARMAHMRPTGVVREARVAGSAERPIVQEVVEDDRPGRPDVDPWGPFRRAG